MALSFPGLHRGRLPPRERLRGPFSRGGQHFIPPDSPLWPWSSSSSRFLSTVCTSDTHSLSQFLFRIKAATWKLLWMMSIMVSCFHKLGLQRKGHITSAIIQLWEHWIILCSRDGFLLFTIKKISLYLHHLCCNLRNSHAITVCVMFFLLQQRLLGRSPVTMSHKRSGSCFVLWLSACDQADQTPLTHLS